MTTIKLEVCVDTLDDAVTAAEAGAHRIELCSALEVGGLTPGIGLVRNAVLSDTPMFAMIRPRAGDFIYSGRDIECMLTDIEHLRATGISGFVFGALNPDQSLDEKSLAQMIAACDGLPTTLNRAFDLCKDPLRSLDVAMRLGFDRVLTSGAAASVVDGLPLLKELFVAATDRIIVLPGGGVTPGTATILLEELPVQELHASCKMPVVETATPGSDVNVGRDVSRHRYRTDPDILHELLNVIASQ
jgi:copper homeostasis protein